MTTTNIAYASSAALTFTASISSGSYRETTAVDNTSNKYVDAHVGGFITTGTSPTVNKRIEIWAYATYDGTTYSGGASGTDAAYTAGEVGQMVLLKTILTDATSDHKYEFGPISIAAAFGSMPAKWGIVVFHDTGVNLNSTGSNHEIKYTGITYTNA